MRASEGASERASERKERTNERRLIRHGADKTVFHCVSTKQRFEDPIVEDVIDVAAPAIAKILNFPPGEPGRTFITYTSRYVTEKEN